jgi:hypothetical protein
MTPWHHIPTNRFSRFVARHWHWWDDVLSYRYDAFMCHSGGVPMEGHPLWVWLCGAWFSTFKPAWWPKD